MKYIFALLISIISFTTAHAQYDDRFYYPEKKWQALDSLDDYEELSFKTDTATLSGLLLKPRGRARATIIYFHGASGNVTTYLSLVEPLVDAGYRLVMIDMQGYGKSTGTPTHLDIAADAQVVFNQLLQRKDIRNSDIIIMGISMGTEVATHLAKDNNDKIAALVLEGTISSFTDIAADSAPEGQGKLIRSFMKSPYSAKEDIKGVKVPVLIIHSKEDKAVPYAEGKEVYDNANEPKELWTITGNHLQGIELFQDAYIKKLQALVK